MWQQVQKYHEVNSSHVWHQNDNTRIQRRIITEPATPGICFSDGFKTRSLVERQILACPVSLAALILIRISNRWEAGGAHCKLIGFTRWAWVSAISLLVRPPLCAVPLCLSITFSPGKKRQRRRQVTERAHLFPMCWCAEIMAHQSDTWFWGGLKERGG